MREIVVKKFSLRDTLECGQTFCWTPHGQGYLSTDWGQVIYVEQVGNRLRYKTSDHDERIESFFRLDDPIDKIHDEICKDDTMRRAIEFAPGLRIVSDPFFPCLVTFLCSIRNNIPSIRRLAWRLREKYGPAYEFEGSTYRGMPSAEELARVPTQELRALGLDWRAEFVSRTAKAICEGLVTEEELRASDYEEAHEQLKRLHGVGDKVADCVCLFSLGFLEAFPIDVWIERVIQRHYEIFTQSGKSYAKKSKAAREYFGQYAGYAQEYLYYYTRSTGRG